MMSYFKKNIQNWLLAAFLLTAVSFNAAYAQVNPYANPYAAGIIPATSPISLNQITKVTMILGNNGASPIPAGGATYEISFTENITPDLASLNLDGGPFTVTSFEDGGVTYVFLTVSGAGIPAKTAPSVKTSYTITINVKGTKVGGPVDMILNAVPDASLSQNLNSSDDNATAPIEVVPPLPVKLVSFSVIKEGNTAQLSWATVEEVNADYFNVERSVNAKDWITIGKKAAAGESKALLNYKFTDAAPAGGSNYYRLKMIDKDETFAYSSIKSAEFDSAKTISFYPNPVANTLFLKDVETQNVKEISIFNTSGVTTYKSASITAAGINVTNFSNGIYILKVVKTDGSVSTHKVVVAK